MSRRKVVNVRTFIDWDSARRILSTNTKIGRNDLGLRSMMEIQNFIAELLQSLNGDTHYRVNYRIYHGWHRGTTKTDDYREFERISAGSQLSRRLGVCSFSPEVVFGNVLLCGGRRSKLYNTLRRREDTQKDEQKMVDTALVSDLLTSVRNDRGSVHIVIGDDDDLIPGVITADSWGARVILARVRREFDCAHLNVTDLIQRRKSA
ncbi:hypothetical protein [Pseudomonas sp. Irchel 3A18]|uniref:hypothetical protein n=1 Tax=Pseudomonas sp. Irchel 3A18 TaxID=2008905 RepID=UPI001179C1D2|nr:hypothetical protein [Pseudomonas sp. Irchel 3A18]